MKKKIHKILGVLLTFVIVVTFSVGVAMPAAADEEEWSDGDAPFDLPDEGDDGDWFYDPLLSGQAHIIRAINGDLYVYADDGDPQIFKSEDGGRTWDDTDYGDDVDLVVVGLAVSSEDSDVIYAASSDGVWKSEEGGDDWEEVGDIDTEIGGWGGGEDITSIAVGYVDDEPHVYVGTSTGAGAGDVYHRNDIGFGGGWGSVDIAGAPDITGGIVDVYGIATSPNFEDDLLVAIVGSADIDNATLVESFTATNKGANAGVWDVVELMQDDWDGVADTTLITWNVDITDAANPVFPEDFDGDDSDFFEYFVGVVGDAHDSAAGGVYRIFGDSAGDLDLLDDIDVDIISLDLNGDMGGTVIIAGANGIQDDERVWYSYDDGDSWDESDKAPSGAAGPTYVWLDDDFDDGDGHAWAVTSGGDGAVSLTADGGETWNQISLIDTAIDWITDIALTDSTSWIVTVDTAGSDTASLFRNDGTYWERVWSSNVSGGDDFDMVAVSPEDDETIFIAGTEEFGWGTQPIYRSTDNGQDWSDLRRQPPEIRWHDAFLVLDDDTLVVGGSGTVYFTDRNGSRAWDDEDFDGGTEEVMSLVASPDVDNDDTLLLGTDDGTVYLSEDLSGGWDQVGAVLDDTLDTFVAFHPDFANSGADGFNVVFAAAGNQVYIFEDLTDDFEDEDWSELDDASVDIASGIAVADDGTLYVLDYGFEDGMQRSVDPLDLDPNEGEEFETVNEDLVDDDEATEFTNMLLVGHTIWATDILSAQVWQYEDTLAVPVTLRAPTNNSTSGREGSVTFHWNELDNADSYQVQIFYQGDLDEDAAMDANPIDELDGVQDGEVWTVPDAFQGLNLLWRVRGMPADPVMSKWSGVWTFTTALVQGQWNPFVGGVPESPGNGDTGVALMPTFAWNAADWATGYEFVLADNANFSGPIASKTVTNTVYAAEAELEYSTTYYWRVRAISPASQSEWGTAVFTTMAEPVAPPPPIVVEPTPPPPPAPAPVQIPVPAAIPTWALVTIIAIGAVLATVVIVLIVRTRRAV